MTKKLLIVLAIVAMLAAMLPTTVLGRDVAQVKVWIRNSTGGEIQVSLKDAAGNYQYVTALEGVNEYLLNEGVYTFYTATLCGAQSGVWNFGATRTLIIDCKKGELSITPLGDKCADKGWYVFDGGNYYISWSTWGTYTSSDHLDFLFDVTSGNYIWAHWGCWNHSHDWIYGW